MAARRFYTVFSVPSSTSAEAASLFEKINANFAKKTIPSLKEVHKLLDAAKTEGDMVVAEYLLKGFRERGYKVREKTASLLLKAGTRTNTLPRASALILDRKGLGLPPSRKTYNSLMQYYLAQNKHAEVLSCFGMLVRDRRQAPDGTTYHALITSLLAQDMPEKVREVMAVMKADKVSPTPNTVALLMNHVLDKNDASRAMDFSNLLKAEDHTAEVLDAVVRCHVSTKNEEGAMTAFASLSQKPSVVKSNLKGVSQLCAFLKENGSQNYDIVSKYLN